MDFIERNIDRQLSLKEIAAHANFSAFHFHRIFGALVGETLNSFIQRIRLERAAQHLAGNPRKSVTAVALDCGFSSSAVFARAFKETFGMSATQFRATNIEQQRKICKEHHKIGKMVRNDGKEMPFQIGYFDSVNPGNAPDSLSTKRRSAMAEMPVADVRVEDLAPMTVAYVRHIGPYAGDEQLFAGLFERLMKWAGPRGFLSSPNTRTLIVYHDNPEVTDQSKLRTSVCVTVPEGTPVNGEIGIMTVPGGKYAMARFEIDAEQYEQAWNAVCGEWLPDSGYQPDDRPCFELCLNDPHEHPEHKHIVEICVPVKPL